jgi:hypothetical protein
MREPFSFSNQNQPMKFNNLQRKPYKIPAKCHVKPENQISLYSSTTSTLHGSYLQAATIEVRDQKAPAKKPGLSP